jgi:alkyl hydroperoxide reductase subunit AhpC
MLNVGQAFPSFRLNTYFPKTQTYGVVESDSLRGRWSVLFSVPFAFTEVCPTEVAEFAAQAKSFEERGVDLYMFSMDSEFVLKAWRDQEKLLENVWFPLLSDFKRELSTALDIVHTEDGCPLRATFVLDNRGIVRHCSCYDLSNGRSVGEILRTVDALQSRGMTACDWKRGDKLL